MSSSQEQLILEPLTELRFRGTWSTNPHTDYLHSLLFIGPFREGVTVDMKITNPTTKRAYYKVKTTSPKKFCAQPNIGILNPNQTATVLGTILCYYNYV